MSDILPRSDDLDATWNFIQPGINKILGNDDSQFNKRVNKVLSPTMYMEVYTAIYNYCVNKSRSSGHFNADKPTGSQNQSSILVGSEIYERLQKYLKHYIGNFQRQPDESFLKFYVRHWKRYTIGAIFLNHTFDYMNRYWVQKERSDGKRHIFDVNTLCLMTWKEVMFDPNSTVLVNEILNQITEERDGKNISRGTLTTAIKSFVALGIDPQDLKKLNLNVYIQAFEIPFLARTEAYYKEYSEQYLATHSVSEYIVDVHQIIFNEERTLSIYWDEHTRKPLSETLNKVLIKDHVDKLEADFITLLDSKDETQISGLYNLMNRDFTLLPKLATAYEEYVKKAGENAVMRLLAQHKAAVTNNQNNHNGSAATHHNNKKMALAAAHSLPPKEYIKNLLEVYNVFRGITMDCFENDALFAKALDNACRAYINNNEFALPPGSPRSATSKTSEMLAKYSDQLLKKSTKPEISQDMSIDDIMTIFKFLTDKDAFESHYRRLFAKRLIHGTSTSDEDEESVIQRLQSENSMEYTGKITKMFQDVRLSKLLEDEFDVMIKRQPDYSQFKYPELQPFILAESMWPFSYSEVEFNLPEELKESHKQIQELYTSKHNGRVLKWLWPLCRADLKAEIGKAGRDPFIFTVTLFQLSILLLFNDSDIMTLEQIQDGTNLSIQNIAASMVPFIKFKLVQQLPPGLEALVKPETQFKLNTPYKALKSNINFAGGVKNDILNALSHSSDLNAQRLAKNATSGNANGTNTNGEEGLTETERVEKELNTERQIFLEACIVRIMKAKRKLPHSMLVNECIAQSHQRFNAKVSMIKRAIDNLIQKGYLQRCDDGESYSYLA
ncbi:cell division control protein 53 [Monosporozyma unispora]|nr:ubiquitin ligase (cullin) of SCF [Kazachstania unispora]